MDRCEGGSEIRVHGTDPCGYLSTNISQAVSTSTPATLKPSSEDSGTEKGDLVATSEEAARAIRLRRPSAKIAGPEWQL
jgi:hypothetical protein